MPMPKPKSGESKNDWMSRCMGDGVMLSEFPDDKQRAAVCSSIWTEEQKTLKVVLFDYFGDDEVILI